VTAIATVNAKTPASSPLQPILDAALVPDPELCPGDPPEEVALGFGVAVPPVVIGPVSVADVPVADVDCGPKVGEPERSEISGHSVMRIMYSKSLGMAKRH